MSHKYPCISWQEERSCSECRQIADEQSYWDPEEWKSYWKSYWKEQKEQKEGLKHA